MLQILARGLGTRRKTRMLSLYALVARDRREQLEPFCRAIVELVETVGRHVVPSASDSDIHRDWALNIHLRV